MLDLAWGARTDVGRRRSRNEDAYVARPPVFAVADGMGGHDRGDVAAAMAIESLATFETGPVRRSDLLAAIRRGHDTITELAVAEGASMGTTLCGVASTDGDEPGALLVFNIGDSRVYRLRRGSFAQMTHDHSVVQELLDDGSIAPAQARSHPERHVVTRSLGAGGHLDIDWWTVEPETGDRYLICSDGLVKEVDVATIATIIESDRAPQELADELVAASLEAGGNDNITVVVVEIRRATPGKSSNLVEVETNPRDISGPTTPSGARGPAEPVVVAHLTSKEVNP